MRVRKSLFSEVNFLLKCLSCSRSSDESRSVKQVPAEVSRGQLCLENKSCESSKCWLSSTSPPTPPNNSCCSSQEEQTPNTGWGRVHHRVTVQKSHILGKCIFVLRNVRCFLRGWRRLKLVVMRPTECGERGKLRALRKFAYCSTVIRQRQRMQRGLHEILQPCWCN